MTTSDQPMDHVPPAGEASADRERSDLERHITAKATWLRFLFMVVFGLLYGLSRLVIAAVVVIQFFHVLLSGETNSQLKTFGRSLAIYTFELVEYLTFNSDIKPFPLGADWPQDLPLGQPAATEEAADSESS